jgi:hypothetical protein
MKLKEFLENLNELVKENPQVLEYEVIYAKDDEGNGFREVVYTPSVGFLDDENKYTVEESEDWEELEEEPNVICIN